MKIISSPMNMGPIIGHRGAAGLAPENTLTSFDMAYQYGCRSIECDVKLSVDGQAFIFHDDTLNRTTNGRGKMANAHSDYLYQLDAGSWFGNQFAGIKIPTLQQALLWALEHDISLNLELKPDKTNNDTLVRTVLDHLEEYWPISRPLPMISSFDIPALQLCRKYHASIPLGYLLKEWHESSLTIADSLHCVAMNLGRNIVTKKRVLLLKQRGFLVYVYTVNQQALISKYQSWGVNGIFSDYPNWIWSHNDD